jgi:putative membrane protein
MWWTAFELSFQFNLAPLRLGDALESCERIFTSPVPLVYTRHTARFLSVWLLLLPLALWRGGAGW